MWNLESPRALGVGIHDAHQPQLYFAVLQVSINLITTPKLNDRDRFCGSSLTIC